MRIFAFCALAAVVVSSLEQASEAAAYRSLAFSGKERVHSSQTGSLPQQSDLVEAIKYGLNSMKTLFERKEPQLYSMGLFLSGNDPAKFVAAFNAPQQHNKKLSKAAYAALEATKEFRRKFPLLTRQALKDTLEQQQQQCRRRNSPMCPPASRKYRTSDGSCNNLKEPWWGSAMSTMQRLLPAVYEDGIDSVRRSVKGAELLPSARLVSDAVHRQEEEEEEEDGSLDSITHMLMQWGQFIDHDVTATGQSVAFNGSTPQCCLPAGRGFQPPELQHPDCLPIAVHPDDSRLGQLGVRCLEFVRSGPALAEEDSASCGFGPREQLSQVTSFIDASTIYSSSAQQSDSLRIFRNGLLQYGKLAARKPILPRRQGGDDDDDVCVQGSLSTGCFRAGDGRLSEQPALISLHVIFLRLHNQIATKLSAINSHWTDERTFQESRKIVGAIVQHITYREFLPIVLGQRVVKTFDLELVRRGSYYTGYDPRVNPNVANAFAAAAYRFGHSLVQPSFARFDRGHCPVTNNASIHEEFANPVNLESAGSVDRILLGLVNQPSQKRDEFITAELRDHLFQTPGFAHGMDLAALNVQRGRDHGLAPFVDWRRACGLNAIRDWRDLERVTLRPETARKLARIYAAVEDVDLFSAGLAEKPVDGGAGLVGPTFACIIAQQFRNSRRGDRFWYENPFPESGFTIRQLDEIRRTSLAQILCSTLDNIDDIQPFVMLSVDRLKNRRLPCNDSALSFIDLDPWTAQKAPKSSRRQEKPNKTRINQHNRVTVNAAAGPLRQPHENLTIVINNNAVYSPVYVQDSVYHSPQAVFDRHTQPAYWPKNFPTSPDPPNYHLADDDSTLWMSAFSAERHVSTKSADNPHEETVDRKQQQDWDSESPLPIDESYRIRTQ